jgi:cellulose synthase/poly-beta-1,6-N-acetylglucosamine synthase-like glycosyltransferase
MSLFYKENPAYLETTLSSLASQTRKADEIIIVIEGELTAIHLEILARWEKYFGKDVLIQVHANLTKGFAACLNLGLKVAKYDIIIRVDTDDYSEPNRIEIQMKEFENNPNLALLSGQLAEYDNNLEEFLSLRKVPLIHEKIIRYSKFRNPINHPTSAYRREIAINLGSYPNVASNEDYAFFVSFFQNNCLAKNLDSILVKARTGSALFDRRRGKKYLKGELECLRYIYQTGYFTLQLYVFHIISRIFIRNLPISGIRGIYKLLR